VDSICAYKDGVAWGGFPNPPDSGGFGNPPYAFIWDTRADSDGVHLWQARAWDEAGNIGVSIALLVRVKNNPDPPPEDHTPPVVNWLSPQPGDTLQGNVELRFQVMDNVGVDSVYLFINGRSSAAYTLQVQQDILYSFEWRSNDFEDGSYYIEIRAKDLSGNIGFLPPVNFMVWNHRPRVIWVPDDYQTIQAAIWASENGDTVRVREGVYREWLNMFDKNIWLESVSGPELTIIDLTGAYAFWIEDRQDTTSCIRGFTIVNNSDFECYGLSLYGGNPKIINNIFTGENSFGLQTYHGNAIIRNNLMINLICGAALAHSWGDFSNNMIIHISQYGLWNAAGNGQPLVPDYNLLWNYPQRQGGRPFYWGEHNIIDQEPLFEEGSYILKENSPGVNQGRPDLEDLNRSRSDIGVYGGPLSYPPQ